MKPYFGRRLAGTGAGLAAAPLAIPLQMQYYEAGDWLLNGADEQVSTVLDSVTPGNIVLLTDRDECAEQTLEALPQIIDGLIADGYKIVTLSDLVKTDTSLSKKLTSLTKVTMPKDAVFPQLAEDDDTTE